MNSHPNNTTSSQTRFPRLEIFSISSTNSPIRANASALLRAESRQNVPGIPITMLPRSVVRTVCVLYVRSTSCTLIHGVVCTYAGIYGERVCASLARGQLLCRNWYIEWSTQKAIPTGGGHGTRKDFKVGTGLTWTAKGSGDHVALLTHGL